MKELLELARSMALCKAYEVVRNITCKHCGLPACSGSGWYEPVYHCDSCGPQLPAVADGQQLEEPYVYDLEGAPAVRRLMRIAKGE